MMKRLALLIAAFLVTGMVRNLQTVKSDDYEAEPKKIVVPEVPVGFDREFADSLTRKMAECGVALSFSPATDADARLQILQLGSENSYGPHVPAYTSMIRYEFTLIDLASSKNVWKLQGDFVLRQPSSSAAERQAAAVERSDDWADNIVWQMRRDKLIRHCGSSVAIAPPALPPPQEAAAPAAPATAPMRFKIGDTVYNSKEEAEIALRADAAREVSKLEVAPGQSHGGLLVVFAVPKPLVKPAALPNDKGPSPELILQMMTFGMMTSGISGDSSVESLKKTGLFSPVEVIHADDVADDDFRGQPYKLYVPKEPGAKWTLARQGGGASPLSTGPFGGSNQAALHKWVDAVSAALNGLGG